MKKSIAFGLTQTALILATTVACPITGAQAYDAAQMDGQELTLVDVHVKIHPVPAKIRQQLERAQRLSTLGTTAIAVDTSTWLTQAQTEIEALPIVEANCRGDDLMNNSKFRAASMIRNGRASFSFRRSQKTPCEKLMIYDFELALKSDMKASVTFNGHLVRDANCRRINIPGRLWGGTTTLTCELEYGEGAVKFEVD